MSDDGVAEVRSRVVGLERGHAELRADVHNVEQRMERGFAAVDEKVTKGFYEIASKLDAKTTTSWQPIAILVPFLLTVGWALYAPIQANTLKQEVIVETIRNNIVPRVEHDRLWRDQSDDQRRFEERIRRLWEEQNSMSRDLSHLKGTLGK